MNAEIHPDGTLRITPDSITEQVALMAWWDSKRVIFQGCPADVIGIKVGSLVPCKYNSNKEPSK